LEEWLRIGASIASILTSIIAAGASFAYWANKRSKRTRLERYLKAKRETSPAEAFSATRLMADLGMTETEVFAASLASRHVARGVRRDPVTGFAAEVLFQYRDAAKSARAPFSDSPDWSQDGLRYLGDRGPIDRKPPGSIEPPAS
jgi:hypothetical protein